MIRIEQRDVKLVLLTLIDQWILWSLDVLNLSESLKLD